ncbi:MAG: transglycosylase SLT domain-containing protein [Rhodobacter sp.]|uniref:transglycosylase SLT domain-containing protein n=1 Tax=Pararhodobacter sp. TaxID=2127056 RepID=UPI001DDADBAA|nr:transglycosylase SLT domain-containing protein [Pararhodobacter sp.]MCB1346814.1 transglycosylase SLT domain-containing protein [Paracoccaceae bacterium]MCC0073788.1 transglycosylase SLT domain-containing protein [Rhodobacter sp.]HPD91928.1 transglycosylase SLT domain-containing protein [Pararhodobacter sp.]
MRLALILVAGLAACASAPQADTGPAIAARWNHRAEASAWNDAMMRALMTHGTAMVHSVPADVTTFCPRYESATARERAAFYVAFFSGLARFESTWNPRASGGGGAYRGLLQIAPATARHHGCDLPEAGLYDGAANLACAVRIANAAVTRDGVLARGAGGVAADWPPMRNPDHRREVAAFTAALPQCRD